MSKPKVSPLILALDARRRELKISQRKLADMVGTTQSHISEILSGRTSPTIGVAERIASALDCFIVVQEEAAPPPLSLITGNQREMARLMGQMGAVMERMAVDMERLG